MDHIIQMKDILITEGQTPVNGQRVIINALFIYNKYVWMIYLILIFQIKLLFCNFYFIFLIIVAYIGDIF